jgi:hypothetical protein
LTDYRRCRIPGGCYFFTVNLLGRYPNDKLVRHIDLLRAAIRQVRQRVVVGYRIVKEILRLTKEGSSDSDDRDCLRNIEHLEEYSG